MSQDKLSETERKEIESYISDKHQSSVYRLLRDKDAYSDIQSLAFLRLYRVLVSFINEHKHQPLLIRDHLKGLALDQFQLELTSYALLKLFPDDVGVTEFRRIVLETHVEPRYETYSTSWYVRLELSSKSILTQTASILNRTPDPRGNIEPEKVVGKTGTKHLRSSNQTFDRTAIFFHYLFKVVCPNSRNIDKARVVHFLTAYSVDTLEQKFAGDNVFGEEGEPKFLNDLKVVRDMFRQLDLSDIISQIERDHPEIETLN